MLFLLIYYCLISGVCLWTGIVVYSFFPATNSTRYIVHFLITGLIGLTAFAQLAVLFFPVNGYMLLLFLTICGIITFFRWQKIGAGFKICLATFSKRTFLFYF